MHSHLGIPMLVQLGPMFIFTWDTPGHSHLGIPMQVPIGTHLYFYMVPKWALSLEHSHVRPNWDPLLFSHGTQGGTPTCQGGITEVSLWCHFCVKGVSSTCRGCVTGCQMGVSGVSWTRHGSVKGINVMSLVCEGYDKGISRRCYGHVMGVLRGCQRYVKGMS